MKLDNSKLVIFVAAAAISGVLGTLAFTNIQADSQESNVETLGIGAYVTVEAYHEDGTLYEEVKHHNLLSSEFRNILVGCITGEYDSTNSFPSCKIDATSVQLEATPQAGPFGDIIRIKQADLTLLPIDCAQINCTGWKLEAVFDFNDIDCTPTVDCFNVHFVESGWDQGGIEIEDINRISVDPQIPIQPNDRVVVTMEFEIPQ